MVHGLDKGVSKVPNGDNRNTGRVVNPIRIVAKKRTPKFFAPRPQMPAVFESAEECLRQSATAFLFTALLSDSPPGTPSLLRYRYREGSENLPFTFKRLNCHFYIQCFLLHHIFTKTQIHPKFTIIFHLIFFHNNMNLSPQSPRFPVLL